MDSIRVEKPRKNKFDLSREVKMTGNMGALMPCFIQDVIPGDSYRVNTQQMIRFSPLLAPIMHNVDFKVDYFFVPYRLVWSEWKDFITRGEQGLSNEQPSYPRFKVKSDLATTYFQKSSLADYLGIPPLWSNCEGDNATEKKKAGAWDGIASNNTYLSLLPFRAYQLIYHEYFRDQNVGTEYEQYTTSGIVNQSNSINPEIQNTLQLRNVNWEKDYFTSALPFLQRGPEVELPLGEVNAITVETLGYGSASGTVSAHGNDQALKAGGLPFQLKGVAESMTINELRKATAVQRWLEISARAGSRYREQILSIFGERIPDYTVQIPKYLGGGKTSIMISEVLSNYTDSTNPNDNPAGQMSGHALGLGDGLGFTESFDEHGILLGLARVQPKTAYIQGLSKFWQKFHTFDHYFPQFANLGEQEVTNGELFITGNPRKDGEVFGYQQRYAEYKYSFNRIAGDFRDTLAYWELSRRFDRQQTLSQEFIECDPDTRIFAIDDEGQPHTEDKIWISLYHKVDALRPMPYHSNPSLN